MCFVQTDWEKGLYVLETDYTWNVGEIVLKIIIYQEAHNAFVSIDCTIVNADQSIRAVDSSVCPSGSAQWL